MSGSDLRIHKRQETISLLRQSLNDLQIKLKLTKSTDLRQKLQNDISGLKYALAGFLVNVGAYNEAYGIYESLSWCATDELEYFGMTVVLIESKRYDKAKMMLEEGLAKYPEYALLWHNLGNLYHSKGNYAQALKYFEKADYLSPDDPAILTTKGNALYGIGCYEEAHDIFLKLSAEYPEEPHHISMLGYCNLSTGYPEAAANYFKQLLHTEAETPDTYNGLYWAYWDMGLSSDALDLIQEGIRKYPREDSQLYIDIGHGYCWTGWTDEASDILKKGLEIFPDDEGIKDVLKQLDEYPNDPDKGNKPQGSGLILLLLKKGKQYRNA